MILGVGTDIIEIERVASACEKKSFLNKYFTAAEINNFESINYRAETLAGSFAAKEAVAKALRKGFSGFSPIDIEILRDEKGAPYAVLKGKAYEAALGVNISISISHSKDYAVAFAVAEEVK